jgi:hypothetical protein
LRRYTQTVGKILMNPFALGGIIGDGKRPEAGTGLYQPTFQLNLSRF